MRLDHVACGTDGVNERVLKASIHFFTQPHDEYLHGARVVAVVALPHAITQFNA